MIFTLLSMYKLKQYIHCPFHEVALHWLACPFSLQGTPASGRGGDYGDDIRSSLAQLHGLPNKKRCIHPLLRQPIPHLRKILQSNFLLNSQTLNPNSWSSMGDGTRPSYLLGHSESHNHDEECCCWLREATTVWKSWFLSPHFIENEPRCPSWHWFLFLLASMQVKELENSILELLETYDDCARFSEAIQTIGSNYSPSEQVNILFSLTWLSVSIVQPRNVVHSHSFNFVWRVCSLLISRGC